MCKSYDKHLKIFVEGIVQGVGFRPHAFNMALSHGLKGYVLNDARGVTIEAEAPEENLRSFIKDLRENPPPLAYIEKITESLNESLQGYGDFVIQKSHSAGEKTVLISPDIATCNDCLREMKDPEDPRHDYPFINCTNCGPRFTIITDVPYDRKNTSMAEFPMCPYCREQYNTPSDRRFHAQPVACPKCGPQAALLDNRGKVQDDNPRTCIKKAVDLLKQGKILAVKGLGGFHLAVDALNDEAVAKLRRRKYREDKPFAVMIPDLESAGKYCHVSVEEEKILASRRSPIVLLKKKDDTDIASQTAPGNNHLGLMLPYTPLHHLVMSLIKRPLVMTSGNISDEPISYINGEALSRLSSIADFFLVHNRPVHIRCDDTVTRIFRGEEYPLRRSRGYVPFPVILKKETPVTILATGAELKSTFCLYRGNRAFVSHHIGDLENLETLRSYEKGIEHFQRLFDVKPEVVAYDPHPRYLSTQFAMDFPVEKKIPVQHHHAHIVSCMADRDIEGEVIGIALDGVGYGLDGKLWGCEFMRADRASFQRMIHLKYVRLAGGEKAIKEPWRVAAAYLYDIYGDDLFKLDLGFLNGIEPSNVNFITNLLDKSIGSPEISSAGRLFDAVSALVGIRSFCNFEAQAAIELEMIAHGNENGEYPVVINKDACPAVIDPADIFHSVIADMKKGVEPSRISARFHNTMARMVQRGAELVREKSGLSRVVLSGGVFQNMYLLEKAAQFLEESSFQVITHNRVPANDGGISLGQAASARDM